MNKCKNCGTIRGIVPHQLRNPEQWRKCSIAPIDVSEARGIGAIIQETLMSGDGKAVSIIAKNG